MRAVSAESKFGSAVRRLRLAKGLSQESLADRAGLHRTYIGSIERGERNPSLSNIIRLAKALSVTPSQLVAEMEVTE
jgi:transcriptional regulator with XRE-family HTH domain